MVPLVGRVTPWSRLSIASVTHYPAMCKDQYLVHAGHCCQGTTPWDVLLLCRDSVPQFSVNSWGQVDEPSAQLKNIALDIVFVSVGKLLLQKRRECPYSFALRLTKTWGFSSSLQLHRKATKEISQKKRSQNKTKQSKETSSKTHFLLGSVHLDSLHPDQQTNLHLRNDRSV